MDILETKKVGEFDQDLQDIINKLKIGNEKIELKGSSSLKSQKYFSDYDLFSQITKNLHPKIIYEEISKKLKFIDENPDLYFIEMKIQNKLGKKYKYFVGDDFNFENFNKQIKNLDFIKIDFIYYFDNRFIEVSVIYKFDSDKISKENFLKGLYEEIKELKKEKKYFKVLKRYFSVNKILGNKKNLLRLNKILNSPVGGLYQLKSNLEALKTIADYYDDDLTKRRIIVNLKDLKLNPNISSIQNEINKLQKEINNDVEKYID